TGSASSVGASSATLNGSVDPNGRATTYTFEYGTSTSYGSKTGAKSAGSSTTAQHASFGISGLEAGRVYHFRIVATSDAGTSVGADESFTTVGAPAVQTGSSQSVGADSGIVTGTLDTHGRSTTWWFDYGTATSYGKSTPSKSASTTAGAQTVSATLTGLAAA